MALVSKREFAELCGKQTKWLSNYIGRGQVIVGDNDLIDTKDDKNAAFLQRHGASSVPIIVAPAPQKKGKNPLQGLKVTDDEGNEVDMDAVPDMKTSERLLKHLDAEKRKREIIKLELDNQKKQGEVVPVEPIGHLVFQFKQYILTQQKITYERFLDEVSHKYSITPEDMAQYRGHFIKALNQSMIEATENFTSNLESILKEYTVKRGVGERA